MLFGLGTGFLPTESEATQLLRKIWKKVVVKPKDEIDEIDEIQRGRMIKTADMETYPSWILFLAAEEGNTKFLLELIDGYPDLIYSRNDDGQSIFHIGVIYRHESIYNLFHSVAMSKGRKKLSNVTSAVLQLHRDLLWLMEHISLKANEF